VHWNESLARHFAHRVQDAGAAHATRDDLVVDHLQATTILVQALLLRRRGRDGQEGNKSKARGKCHEPEMGTWRSTKSTIASIISSPASSSSSL
jgi:hypothetical protein